MIMKLVMLADIMLEFVMFVYEMIKLHQLEKQGVDVIVKYSEQERRQKFAKKFACRTMTWLGVILLGVVMC